MSSGITLTPGDIGVVTVISTLVAVAVQLWFQSRTSGSAATRQSVLATPQPTFGDIPQEHIAVIAAAVASVLGTHRVVHIETPDRGYSWTAEARTVHHTSHTTR